MLEKIARKLTRRPKLVIVIAVLMLIPSILGAAFTRINYDILSYLPQDMDSAKGEALLEDPFRMAATTMLIVEDMPPEYTHQLQDGGVIVHRQNTFLHFVSLLHPRKLLLFRGYYIRKTAAEP